jgi:hypothetical protein
MENLQLILCHFRLERSSHLQSKMGTEQISLCFHLTKIFKQINDFFSVTVYEI